MKSNTTASIMERFAGNIEASQKQTKKGRPASIDFEEYKSFNIKLPKDVNDYLHQKAYEAGTSKNAYIVDLIRKDMEGK